MNAKPSSCPACNGEHIIPIIYGMPDADLVMKDAAGEAVIGGVATYGYSPEWHCTSCKHQWRTSPVVEVEESDLNASETEDLRSQLEKG